MNEFELGVVVVSGGTLECHSRQHKAPTTWCNHIFEGIEKGYDAEDITPGLTISVPIFPTSSVYAVVQIDQVDFAPGHGSMTLRFMPDVGREQKIPLGFWNPGEGRKAIRSVILDYLMSRIDPDEDLKDPSVITKCPATKMHSMKAARKMKENKEMGWKWRCLWNIVMEGACSVCIDASADLGDNNGLDGLEDEDRTFSGRHGSK